jgi:ribosomal-protein-alanine N-acetyltransferase
MEASFKLVFEDVEVRPLRLRDWRQLEAILQAERKWLEPWEATVPGGSRFLDVKGMVRSLLRQHRDGSAIAAIIEYRGKMVGQLNVANILYGSVSSGSIGYWVSEKCAGKGITPAAVALIVDYMFIRMGLHRAEIAIRPENKASLRIVEKLNFRHEGTKQRFIHIDGDWRDHEIFALTREEAKGGVLAKFSR